MDTGAAARILVDTDAFSALPATRPWEVEIHIRVYIGKGHVEMHPMG